ncbi:glycosyltransferase family 4 protein [Cohnella abietis]|uniref:Glycosyl transferase family 1 n=1 Tax=Cohnella abietis TaxID=2507935 RepID=A0A3T1DE52_9BACL|nr:glycosyltransferase family 1 protein [Cohnella abietis]BBI36175.1 glycosyl transferase family 1 [Cohnella abietis]
MKIGFDVSQTAEDMAGCGFFSKQVASHMILGDRKNEYFLYPMFYGYRHPNFKEAYHSEQPNVQSFFRDLSWHKANRIWSEVKDKDELLGNPDIVHSNNFSFPDGIKAKKVVTIYDMGYLDCPEYTTEANRLVCFEGAYAASLNADHIVTISNFSKQSFLKYFPYYPESRVSVIYLGNRPTLKWITDGDVFEQVKNKFELEETFWLGVGTVEPRKNYGMLLEAYAQLVAENQEKRPLYIAGGKGWMEDHIQDKVRELGIVDLVKFLGYVSDDELSVLYSNCFGFVYPSRYEGFGLPVLEAMSCGAPIITSNTSSLPEVAGEAGIYIDPDKVQELTQAMRRLSVESGLRESLIDLSKIQAEKFSWNKAADQLLEIYEKVMVEDSWNRADS